MADLAGNLTQDNTFYRLLVQNMPGTAVIVFDKDLRYLAAEGPFLEAAGYDARKLIGKTLWEALPNDPQIELLPAYRAALDGQIIEFVRHYNTYWYRARTAPIRDANGVIIAGMIVAHDISAQKESEQALRDSESRYRLLADNSSDMVMLLNRDFAFLYVSPSVERVLGYTPEEMVNHPGHEFVHPDDIPAMIKARQFISAENPTLPPLAIRIRHKDGHYLWMERTGQSIHSSESGELDRIAIVVRDITERLEAEIALKDSETRYRMLAETSSDLILQQDRNYKFVYVSPACERLLGYLPEELLGCTPLDLIHPDDVPALLTTRKAVEQQMPIGVPLTYRLQHKGGHYLWFERLVRPLYDETNHDLIGFISTLRDITERHKAEEALRESEYHYRLLADNSQDLITLQNTNFEYIYVSPSSERILGYTPDEMLGNDPLIYSHPDDAGAILAGRKTPHVQDEVAKPYTIRFRRKNGQYAWLERTGQILYSEPDHTIIGYVAALRDVTARHNAEEALRESEARFRQLVENSLDGILMGTSEGRILMVNQAMCKMLGRTEAELMKLGTSALLDTTDARTRQFIDGGPYPEPVRRELTALRQDGTRFPMEITVADSLMSDGTFQYWSIARDLTEPKQYQAALIERETLRAKLEQEAELSQLKSGMMVRVAHEFRTPLAIIQATTETLTTYAERLTPNQKAAKTANIRTSIQRLTDMLSEIEVAVKGTLVPDELRIVPIDLSSLCSQVAREIETHFDLPGKFALLVPESVMVAGDLATVKNAVLHVMRNAARYSAPSDVVQVTLAPNHNGTVLIIQDRGIGILPEEQERIFEPFFRGSNMGEIRGLGLGLTIARASVEAHHGTIQVESTPGSGTTVSIWLPQRMPTTS